MGSLSLREYHAPASLQELSGLLASGRVCGFLCGGTDLLVQLQGGALEMETIIDLKKLSPLRQLTLDKQGLTVGAAVSCAEIAADDEIARLYPGLVDAVSLVGSIQIQNRASIGGNLCNASPAADTVAVLLANKAVCTVHTPGGEKKIPARDFILGPGKTALEPGEVLVKVFLQVPARTSADAYLRITPRTEMDIAVAGAAVRVSLAEDGSCEHASVAISAVGPKPLLLESAASAITGTRFDDESLDRLQQAVRAAADPLSDKRGTRDYRLHVIGELSRRAALLARERALGNARS